MTRLKYLAVCLLAVLAQAAKLDLRLVMQTPFASGLSVSPDERHIAWVVNESGKRNIWLADAPHWTARQATRFNTDEGLEIGELAWSPDSRTLVFTRAGEIGAARQPNPTSALQAPKATIWLLAPEGAARAITDGQGAVFSPSNESIWFLRDGQVFSVAISGANTRNEFKCPGTVSDLTWSPDGQRLAFHNDRETHAFIGIFTPDSSHLTYLDPSVDSDSSPVWSPDSKRIVFLRQPAATALPLEAVRREGPPWSIRIYDFNSKITREAFRALPHRGSVHYDWNAQKQLFWSATNNIYFGWERTGWLHLYTIAASGGDPRELTPGDGEINTISLSHDRRKFTYSSNIGDLETFHVAAVSTVNDESRSLTGGSGAEWSGASIAGPQQIAFLGSAYNSGAHVELASETARTMLGPSSVVQGVIKPEPVTFSSTNNLTIHGQLFRTSSTSRRPAIVFVHGGPRRQMLLGFHPMYYYSNAYEMNQYLASLGYIVLSVNYRSGTGYGLDFREAPNFGPAGASEYDDVKSAAEYLKNRSDVDPSRIGIWGGSWGGYLTALALARDSSTFKAGVDFHGVHDWRFEMDSGPDSIERSAFARQAFAASPLAFINGWRSPVLLIHGDDDRDVPFIETVRLVEGLRARNVPFQQLIFPGEIHQFLVWEHWVEAYTKAAEFFEQNIGSPSAAQP